MAASFLFPGFHFLPCRPVIWGSHDTKNISWCPICHNTAYYPAGVFVRGMGYQAKNCKKEMARKWVPVMFKKKLLLMQQILWDYNMGGLSRFITFFHCMACSYSVVIFVWNDSIYGLNKDSSSLFILQYGIIISIIIHLYALQAVS